MQSHHRYPRIHIHYFNLNKKTQSTRTSLPLAPFELSTQRPMRRRHCAPHHPQANVPTCLERLLSLNSKVVWTSQHVSKDFKVVLPQSSSSTARASARCSSDQDASHADTSPPIANFKPYISACSPICCCARALGLSLLLQRNVPSLLPARRSRTVLSQVSWSGVGPGIPSEPCLAPSEILP